MAVLETVRSKLGINYLNKFWINALLSNPKTHMINMTSNTIMAFLDLWNKLWVVHYQEINQC